MPMEDFLKSVDGSREELDALCGILVGHGVSEAIDIAYIEESMVEDILGGRMELAELLRAAVAYARPLIGGWVRAVTRFKVGAGGVVPAGGPEFGQASPEGGPEPRRASHDGVVGARPGRWEGRIRRGLGPLAPPVSSGALHGGLLKTKNPALRPPPGCLSQLWRRGSCERPKSEYIT